MFKQTTTSYEEAQLEPRRGSVQPPHVASPPDPGPRRGSTGTAAQSNGRVPLRPLFPITENMVENAWWVEGVSCPE